MHIDRIGFTPLKGARHQPHATVELAAGGPVGDRAFCLVDPGRDRVVRTVENPTMLQASARHQAGVLTLTLPGLTVEGEPVPTGRVGKVDYWGRHAEVELLDGPWADALSQHLGYDVHLARPRDPGDVVYGAPVTLVTSASLAALSQRVGGPVGSARFRSTLLVDAGDEAPGVEESWVGGTLAVGEARLRVRGVVPRCAVVDLDPRTGIRDAPVLRSLAGYRRGEGAQAQEADFGVDAVVVRPGRVSTGDALVPGG